MKRFQLQLQLHKFVQLITFSSLLKNTRTLDEMKNTRPSGKTPGVAPVFLKYSTTGRTIELLQFGKGLRA